MKRLILITISLSIASLISLSAFSAEVGEDQKSECAYANQSSKREAKELASTEAEVNTEATSNISK